MGSSNLNCAVSNFPINDNERVMCILLLKEDRGVSQPYYPWGTWKFGCLPFEVEMGDYSCPIGVLDCEGSESGEFDTFNPIDKMIYETFRKQMYLYKLEKDGTKTPILTKPKDDRNDWPHVMRYGSYDDLGVGYSHYFNPEEFEKAKSEGKQHIGWLNHFDPSEVHVMFINKKVFDYMTRSLVKSKYNTEKLDRLDEFFVGVDNFILHDKRLREQLDELIKSGHKYETSAEIKAVYDEMGKLGILSLSMDRFEFLARHPFESIKSKLQYNEFDTETVKVIKKKMRQLYNLSGNLWHAQIPISPSHGLAPQGGWYNGVADTKKFHQKMIEIYDARQKQLQNEGF